MSKIQLTKDFSVSNNGEPYIIAELGSNHNGDMDMARKLIQSAKECGAHCVKFQSWSKESIFSRKTYNDNYFVADDYRHRTDHSLESIVEAYSISEAQLLEMKNFCREVDIELASTPFSRKEVDFLTDVLDVPFIKVASMDLNNYPFLKYIGQKGLPIVLSTGLSKLHEIDHAVGIIESTGNQQIVILHCVSIYPPKDEEVNLRNIETLQRIYPRYPIGFSDHTIGVEIPLASVAQGVCMIEKHFTLDKSMEGWDHKVSANHDELSMIVSGSRRIWQAMGDFRIKSCEDEERRSSFRRSIVSTREISSGEIIKEEDIDFKRPGTGISPEFLEFIIGRQVKKTIKPDMPIELQDLI